MIAGLPKSWIKHTIFHLSFLKDGFFNDWGRIVFKQLLKTLKEHDPDTYDHCIRVADLSLTIAKTMNLPNMEQQVVYYGGLMHDIGKLKISKDVLTKPEKLSYDEWGAIQKHPIYGYEILHAHGSIYDDISYIVLFHHERMNGKGYPFGISDGKIPLGAQIVAVADSFDAMKNHRAYSKAKTITEAIEVIISDKGTLFSPMIVDKLVEVLTNNV